MATIDAHGNLETGNRLEIDLTELDANVTYTYRTYVRSSDGISYYGKKETFTTKNYDFDNVVASCSESEVTPFTAKITYTFDTTKFVSDIRDAEATEVGILYSYNRNELSPDSSARSVSS